MANYIFRLFCKSWWFLRIFLQKVFGFAHFLVVFEQFFNNNSSLFMTEAAMRILQVKIRIVSNWSQEQRSDF